MRHNWGRKLLYIFFGRKRTRNDWPQWVQKTDEERIQNCPWVLNDADKEWIATEKIDGSSTTFTYRKDRFKKPVFLVCSRNVAFTKPGKKCYYDTNIYTEMAEKYHMEEVMADMFECRKRADRGLIFVTIQAETYGAGVQRRDYSRKGHDMAIFNVIWGYKDGTVIRWNPEEAKTWVGCWDLPYVPVLGKMTLPNDCDEVLAAAGAEPSQLDGQMREGLVFRSLDGKDSFKAVDNNYLLKYHG
jgi:RNA ligase (TIGR02306 family)